MRTGFVQVQERATGELQIAGSSNLMAHKKEDTEESLAGSLSLLAEVVKTPSLEIFRTQLHKAFSKPIELESDLS